MKSKNKGATPQVVDPTIWKHNYSHLPDDDDGGSSETMSVSTEVEKVEKIPPIVLKTEIKNVDEFYSGLQKITKNIHLRSFNTSKQIFTYTKEDFDKTKAYLIEKNFEFFTYTHKQELLKKLVLKGLDKSIDSQTILADLKMQFSGIMDVKQMNIRTNSNEEQSSSSKHVPYESQKIGSYIVYVTRNTDLDELISTVRIVHHHLIKWEKYHTKQSNGTFCSSCSRWGHGQSNCYMKKRCPLCSLNHDISKCDKKNKQTTTPVCPNCKKQHVASYRECEAYKQYMERRKKLIEQNRQRQINSRRRNGPAPQRYNSNQYIQDNVSYSNIVKSDPNVQSQNDTEFSYLNNEFQTLFGTSMAGMIKKIKEFLPKYKCITDKMEKQISLINFVCEVCK